MSRANKCMVVCVVKVHNSNKKLKCWVLTIYSKIPADKSVFGDDPKYVSRVAGRVDRSEKCVCALYEIEETDSGQPPYRVAVACWQVSYDGGLASAFAVLCAIFF